MITANANHGAGAVRRRPLRRIPHPLGHRACAGQCQLQRRQGRDRRAGRRIRIGQIGHRLCGDGHPRSGRPRHRRPRHARRPRSSVRQAEPACRSARPRHRDDLPESAHRAQSDPAGGQADRRRADPPRQCAAARGAGAGGRNAARGRHHRSGAARQGLSVRNVGRHVPARDDRNRARRQACRC